MSAGTTMSCPVACRAWMVKEDPALMGFVLQRYSKYIIIHVTFNYHCDQGSEENIYHVRRGRVFREGFLEEMTFKWEPED